jgi:glyceraldehyde 3-phosphate dehydrogenase
VALRLAINGLGRISAQLVRVVNEGGFSDLFEIAAIHDAAGPEGITRALRHDSIFGPFPGDLTLDGETLRIGDQSIALSARTISLWSSSTEVPVAMSPRSTST